MKSDSDVRIDTKRNIRKQTFTLIRFGNNMLCLSVSLASTSIYAEFKKGGRILKVLYYVIKFTKLRMIAADYDFCHFYLL